MDGLGLEGDGDETGDGAARRTAVVMMKVVMMKRPSKQLRRHCCELCLSVQWLGWVDQRETAKHARCLGGWGISTLEMALPRDGTKFKNFKSPPFFQLICHLVVSKQINLRNCAEIMRTTNQRRKKRSALINCS